MTAPPHRRDIQGLRAVAVLLVALAHAGVGFLRGGFVGVDVFFVLSGFLITGLLLAEVRRTGGVSLRDFYVRRARRILPAAALTLVAVDVAAYALLDPIRAREVVHDIVYAAAFAANARFAAQNVDYFARSAPPSPVLHYWSLAVEEQFYLVWPLLISLALLAGARLRGLGALVGCLTCASLAWSIHETATAPGAAYFSPFTRAWELGLGASLAVGAPVVGRIPAPAKTVLGWSGLAAIAAAAIVYSSRTPFPGAAALLPTVGAAGVIVAGTAPSRVAAGRLLALRPLGFVGDRSYAFYLWHWPVLIFADSRSLAPRLALLAGAFLLACGSYALVENPIRRNVRRRRTTLVVVAACAASLAGAAHASLAAIDRTEHRFERAMIARHPAAAQQAAPPPHLTRGALPAVIASVEAARRGSPIPHGLTPTLHDLKGITRPYVPPAGCIGMDTHESFESRVCRVGDATSRRLVVLMGDSHALMWLPAVTEMAWHDHLAVVPLLRLGCIPGRWGSPAEGGGCSAWYGWALAQIRRLHPEVTLLGASIDERGTPSARVALEAVVRAAQDLRRIGRTIVIGDPEALDFDPIACLLSRGATMRTCSTTWPPQALAGYDEVRRSVTRIGDGFLPTRGFVCYRRTCPAVIGHTIAYIDDNHLSSAYSASVAPAFRTAFVRQLAKLERTS
ncbi:MAG TPA: acyltransferase family protein [Gaiellaceae bacterium]